MAFCGMTIRGWTITLASLYLLVAPFKFHITYYVSPRNSDEGVIYLNLLTTFFMVFVANVLSLPVLIYGAAKGRSKFISQWLIVGGAVIINNLSMTLLLFGYMMAHPIPILVKAADTPLVIALWVLASRLATQRRNKELDQRYLLKEYPPKPVKDPFSK